MCDGSAENPDRTPVTSCFVVGLRRRDRPLPAQVGVLPGAQRLLQEQGAKRWQRRAEAGLALALDLFLPWGPVFPGCNLHEDAANPWSFRLKPRGPRRSARRATRWASGLLTQGGQEGPPARLGLTIPYGSYPLLIESAYDIVEVTYRRPPWLTGSYHPRWACRRIVSTC